MSTATMHLTWSTNGSVCKGNMFCCRPVAWLAGMWYTPYSASSHLSAYSPSMLPGEVPPMCDLGLDVQRLGHHDSEGVPAFIDWLGG